MAESGEQKAWLAMKARAEWRIWRGENPILVRDELAAAYLLSVRPIHDTWTRGLWAMVMAQLKGEC